MTQLNTEETSLMGGTQPTAVTSDRNLYPAACFAMAGTCAGAGLIAGSLALFTLAWKSGAIATGLAVHNPLCYLKIAAGSCTSSALFFASGMATQKVMEKCYKPPCSTTHELKI